MATTGVVVVLISRSFGVRTSVVTLPVSVGCGPSGGVPVALASFTKSPVDMVPVQV